MGRELTCPYCGGTHIGMGAVGNAHTVIYSSFFASTRMPSPSNVCRSCGHSWRPGETGMPNYWSAGVQGSLLVFGVLGAFFCFLALQPYSQEGGTSTGFWIIAAICFAITFGLVKDTRRRVRHWENRPAARMRVVEPEIIDAHELPDPHAWPDYSTVLKFRRPRR